MLELVDVVRLYVLVGKLPDVFPGVVEHLVVLEPLLCRFGSRFGHEQVRPLLCLCACRYECCDEQYCSKDFFHNDF